MAGNVTIVVNDEGFSAADDDLKVVINANPVLSVSLPGRVLDNTVDPPAFLFTFDDVRQMIEAADLIKAALIEKYGFYR